MTSPAMRPFDASLPMALLQAREAAMRLFRPLLAEHDLTDQRWAEVLATARRIQPAARRLVRTSLKGGDMPTHGGTQDLVHRV